MTEVTPEVRKTVENALLEIRGRSFSGRHPELGKMIKCQVCGTRHRKNERLCIQKIVVPVPATRKGILGAAAFAKKRYRPHSNRWPKPKLETEKEEINGPDNIS